MTAMRGPTRAGCQCRRRNARSRKYVRSDRQGFAPSLLAADPVDLAGHDEVVLVQPFDLLGAQRDGRVAPAEADVGVMAFALGQLADVVDERERFAEVAKSKGPLDAACILRQRPTGSLCLQALGFIRREWRYAAATGGACLLG